MRRSIAPGHSRDGRERTGVPSPGYWRLNLRGVGHLPLDRDRARVEVEEEERSLRGSKPRTRRWKQLLAPFERALVEGMTGEIRNKVTIYRSKLQEVDEHFPRIEVARDSFGTNWAGDAMFQKTDLTLRPGDEVVFECVGLDPRGEPLEWTMSVLPPGSLPPAGGLQTSEGSEARFVWAVGEENIGASCYVEISLISARSWHRQAGYDDRAVFRYTVLPR